jgi:hypothetical protein
VDGQILADREGERSFGTPGWGIGHPVGEDCGVQTETPRRGGRSPRDMALSLLVLLVPIVLAFAGYRALAGEDADAVDPAPAYASARAANTFPVAEPDGLRGGWRPIIARYGRDDAGPVLRVGYATPADASVQLVQFGTGGDGRVAKLIGTAPAAAGTVEAGGRQWQRYTLADDKRAYVLREADRTVVLVGDAADAELRTLAGALR